MLKEIKYNGIETASPDNNPLSGALAYAHNLVNDHGSLEPIADPKLLKSLYVGAADIKCVLRHDMLSGVSNYIYAGTAADGTTKTVGWYSATDATQEGVISLSKVSGLTQIYDIKAVGNTLCILTDKGMDYELWKDNTYKELGTDIPELTVRFSLKLSLLDGGHNYTGVPFISTNRETISNVAFGDINRAIYTARSEGKFVYPFLVRYALKLTDGSLIHHSSPVLMMVNSEYQPFALAVQDHNETDIWTYITAAELLMNVSPNNNFGDWTDIVSSVVVYASAPFAAYSEAPYKSYDDIWNSATQRTVWNDNDEYGGIGIGAIGTSQLYQKRYFTELLPACWWDDDNSGWSTHGQIAKRLNFITSKPDVKGESVFYKIYEEPISVASNRGYGFYAVSVGNLNTLTTQIAMDDDYDSHDTIIPQGAYVYNQRLNIFNITKTSSVKLPFNTMIQYTNELNNPGYLAKMKITMEVDGGDVELYSTCYVYSSIPTEFRYLYLPYKNVKYVEINVNGLGFTLNMENHATLNGSVWFSMGKKGATQGEITGGVNSYTTLIPNKIYTSEVGNPFYFPVSGINTIAAGKITGIAASARAITQGQFGQFPLYVFTDSGVWAMEVSDVGLYKAKQPVSLDIANPNTITPVDTAVAYITDRGLMLLSGGDSKCISDGLDDGELITLPDGMRPFPDFVTWETYRQNIRAAFDTVNQRLYIYNPDKWYHYVYSAKTGQWTTKDGCLVSTVANSLVNKRISSSYIGLADLSKTADTPVVHNGFVITRPLTFDEFGLKRLKDSTQVGEISNNGVNTVIQASNDLQHWVTIASAADRRIVRKVGSPYKYFRTLVLTKPELAGARFRSLSGMIADVEPVMNDKIR